MSKRASGPPRRPRNPIAKDVHTPLYRQRVVPDKRKQQRIREEGRLIDAEKPTRPGAPDDKKDK